MKDCPMLDEDIVYDGLKNRQHTVKGEYFVNEDEFVGAKMLQERGLTIPEIVERLAIPITHTQIIYKSSTYEDYTQALRAHWRKYSQRSVV